MHVTFFGAVREVTGSMHMVGTENDHVLLDCGLFQGRRRETDEKNRVLPFDPSMIANIVLSHAHIDHSGRIPLLYGKGFNGRVMCTRATADTSELLLADSAHIQQQDADYLNYKTVRKALSQGPVINGRKVSKRKYNELKKMLKKNQHRFNYEAIDQLMAQYRLERIEPLYSKAEADQAIAQMEGIPYRHTTTVARNLTCTFYEAGHILGSAISILHHGGNGNGVTIGYTGDIGRFDKPILRDPCLNFEPEHRQLDLLIMESTYGDREHEAVVDLKPALREALNTTFDRGGCVLIPSFAFGRTQELLYLIHELYDEGAVKRMPVYVDSPLAVGITEVFGEHPEIYDTETHETFLKRGKNPFDYQQVHFIQSVEESMALMRETKSHIVISASGMCEAGRILHHLRYKMHDPKNTILIVGFMAQNTLGRRILEQGLAYQEAGRSGEAPILKLLNKEYPLKAQVIRLGGFSAHADKNEMLRFLRESKIEAKRIAVVHGEEEQSEAFARLLKDKGYEAFVPRAGQTVTVNK